MEAKRSSDQTRIKTRLAENEPTDGRHPGDPGQHCQVTAPPAGLHGRYVPIFQHNVKCSQANFYFSRYPVPIPCADDEVTAPNHKQYRRHHHGSADGGSREKKAGRRAATKLDNLFAIGPEQTPTQGIRESRTGTTAIHL